jgi:hypothetical protein
MPATPIDDTSKSPLDQSLTQSIPSEQKLDNFMAPTTAVGKPQKDYMDPNLDPTELADSHIAAIKADAMANQDLYGDPMMFDPSVHMDAEIYTAIQNDLGNINAKGEIDNEELQSAIDDKIVALVETLPLDVGNKGDFMKGEYPEEGDSPLTTDPTIDFDSSSPGQDPDMLDDPSDSTRYDPDLTGGYDEAPDLDKMSIQYAEMGDADGLIKNMTQTGYSNDEIKATLTKYGADPSFADSLQDPANLSPDEKDAVLSQGIPEEDVSDFMAAQGVTDPIDIAQQYKDANPNWDQGGPGDVMDWMQKNEMDPDQVEDVIDAVRGGSAPTDEEDSLPLGSDPNAPDEFNPSNPSPEMAKAFWDDNFDNEQQQQMLDDLGWGGSTTNWDNMSPEQQQAITDAVKDADDSNDLDDSTDADGNPLLTTDSLTPDDVMELEADAMANPDAWGNDMNFDPMMSIDSDLYRRILKANGVDMDGTGYMDDTDIPMKDNVDNMLMQYQSGLDQDDLQRQRDEANAGQDGVASVDQFSNFISADGSDTSLTFIDSVVNRDNPIGVPEGFYAAADASGDDFAKQIAQNARDKGLEEVKFEDTFDAPGDDVPSDDPVTFGDSEQAQYSDNANAELDEWRNIRKDIKNGDKKSFLKTVSRDGGDVEYYRGQTPEWLDDHIGTVILPNIKATDQDRMEVASDSESLIARVSESEGCGCKNTFEKAIETLSR